MVAVGKGLRMTHVTTLDVHLDCSFNNLFNKSDLKEGRLKKLRAEPGRENLHLDDARLTSIKREKEGRIG